MYTKERLSELIEQITKEIEIFKDQRECTTSWYNNECIKDYTPRTEQDFFMAQCLANIDAFGSPDPDNPPRVKNYQVRVETTDEVPVRARPRRFTMIEQAFLEAKTNIMMRQHKLRDSHSDWSHGLVLVPYNDRIQRFLEQHGSDAHVKMFQPEYEHIVSTFYRLCSDMREVNKKTKLDIFPLPRLDDIIDNIPRGTDRFSTGDVMDAFFCVEVHPDDRKKFAFRTHNRHLEFEVMVQGWVNSPSHFCRVIASAMEGLGRSNVHAYLDDVLNHSTGFEPHFFTQQLIYDRLRSHQLMFKPLKTKINFPEIKFLGHILSQDGISPDPDKVKAVSEVEDPRDVTGVRSFLGATLFYRRFIHKYGDLAQPLYALTKKGVNVRAVWDDNIHGVAMDALKKALTSSPVLRLFDPARPVQIRLDACKVGRGIGAILLQPDDDGEWHPVEYWSKALSDTERNYSATELECKALHDALLHWHMYISCGQPVDIYSDHNALQYMVNKATATNNGRLLHYLMDLQGYRFKLHYKKGELNSDADWISRAWHITDFVAETRDGLDTAIGLVLPPEQHVERAWGAVNRKLKKLQRLSMRALNYDTFNFKLPVQSSGGEEGVDKNDRMSNADKIDDCNRMSNADKIDDCKCSHGTINQDVTIQIDDCKDTKSNTKRNSDRDRMEDTQSIELIDDIRSEGCSEEYVSGLQSIIEGKEKIISDCFRISTIERIHNKIKRIFTGKRILRNRKKVINYNEDLHILDKPHRKEWRTDVEHPIATQLGLMKKEGYRDVKILESTIPEAGWGLFSTKVFDQHDVICTYEGALLASTFNEDDAVMGRDYIAKGKKPIGKTGKFEMVYIDAWEEDSCFGRFINDPLDDHLVNAKIVVKGNKFYVVATDKIHPGQEIFISYGENYWRARQHLLSENHRSQTEGARVQDCQKRVRFDIDVEVITFKKNSTLSQDVKSLQTINEEIEHPEERNLRLKLADQNREDMRKVEEEYMKKYAYDGVIQCPELAEEMQFLVGRKFIDSDNNGLYEVSSVSYNSEFDVVVGTRRPMDGRPRKYDDCHFCVFGMDGLLELTDVYLASHEDVRVWPNDLKIMSHKQREDPELRKIIEQCEQNDDLKCECNKNQFVLLTHEDDYSVLYREEFFEKKGAQIQQLVVPKELQLTCMKMFHEGFSHPGIQRCLETMKLYYFWEGQRKDVTQHISDCLSCQLRKVYQGRPMIPVMKYPRVVRPLERLHMDLTGPFVTSKGGMKYILVVKDYLTKFVWLFAIKSKHAEDVAKRLVNDVFCEFGIPVQLYSDKGTEFVNKLVSKINHLFKVSRMTTTSYNPRSNGLVENHNKTLKDQLHHFVGVLQNDWDNFLPTVQLMYNTTVSSATSLTPFFMMFGRECNLPSGGIIEKIDKRVADRCEELDVQNYMNGLLISLECAWSYAVGKSEKNFLRFNEVPKYHRKFVEYEPGQKFMRLKKPVYEFKSADDQISYHLNAKLQTRYDGPHKVIRKLSPVLYEVEINGVEKRISAINMKPV